MQQPPILHSPIPRLVRVAKIDGWSIFGVAIVGAGFALWLGDLTGALGGILAAAAGIVEVYGAVQLSRQRIKGLAWMAAAQVGLLCIIDCYCAWNLMHPHYAALKASIPKALIDACAESGVSPDDLIRLAYPLTYACLSFATLIYQGGMAWYYLRQSKKLGELLGSEETL